jgi:uncharacterized membrane protein
MLIPEELRVQVKRVRRVPLRCSMHAIGRDGRVSKPLGRAPEARWRGSVVTSHEASNRSTSINCRAQIAALDNVWRYLVSGKLVTMLQTTTGKREGVAMRRAVLTFLLAVFCSLGSSPATNAQVDCYKNCGCYRPAEVGHRTCGAGTDPSCHVTDCQMRKQCDPACQYDYANWNDRCATNYDWWCTSVFFHNCGDCDNCGD